MFPHERKLQQVQQQRLLVEQLRREAAINRINVSQVGIGVGTSSLQIVVTAGWLSTTQPDHNII